MAKKQIKNDPTQKVKIKVVKQWGSCNPGEILEVYPAVAESGIKKGYAEIFKEGKQRKAVDKEEEEKPIKKVIEEKPIIQEIDPETKKFYDKYIGQITCAYAKDIYLDSEEKERCGAKRTEKRDEYLFRGLTEETVLIECPKDILAIEFETHNNKDKKLPEYKEVPKEQLKEWIKKIVENAKSQKIDYCVCDHGGTSPYFYACNFSNLIENKEKECKKELANLIVPKEAIDFIDFSNLGSTLIPIIERPHWKKSKYNGSIHKIIEGKHPLKHKNKLPDIVLQRVIDNERPNFPKVQNYGDSDINSLSLTSIISIAKLKKRGQEYQGSNPWHGSGTGMNFCFNAAKNIWHCFRCGAGGSVAKAIALNKGIIRSCDEDLTHEQFKQVLQIAREDYGLKKPEPKQKEQEQEETKIEEKIEYKKIKLADLNASLVNKFVEVDCQITGEQSQKAIAKIIKVNCGFCECEEAFDVPKKEAITFEESVLLKYYKGKKICKCKESPKHSRIKEYTDFSIIFVRDLLNRESLTAIKRYESKRVYITGKTLPNAKKVNIKGQIFIEAKTKNISIICDEIKPLENQMEDFKITEQFKENAKKYFNSGENLYKQINPDIVGKAREIAKQSLILQLHSPCKIYDITRKKLIRGGLNIIFYGDTKAAKSDIAKDITQKGTIPVGEYTICETGGRTGFLYTIDRDKGSLIWGSLALNDMGLVVLDGLQSMHSEELGEFREAIEGQEIIVRRSISGEALARTRILGCLNPNKPMINYIYKCQALQDTYVFSKSPEFTRWDLFIPFGQRDVPGKEIAHRDSEDKPIPENIFIDHIYWVWSRKPDQIIYTESAVKKINEFSEYFIENYALETLPIIHNGVRDVLTRLSVSWACKMHSTDETHEKIIVETEHVEKAIQWYIQVLDMIEIARFKQDIEGKSELTNNDCFVITKEIGDTEWQILEEIKHTQKTSTQLSAILDKSVDTIKEHYKILKKHNLIETKTGQGVSLSIKGVRFVRWGMLLAGGLGEKTPTNKNDSGEKTHQLTSKKEYQAHFGFDEDLKKEIMKVTYALQERMGKLIPIEELKAQFKDKIPEQEFNKILTKLKDVGIIFSPRENYIQLIDSSSELNFSDLGIAKNE